MKKDNQYILQHEKFILNKKTFKTKSNYSLDALENVQEVIETYENNRVGIRADFGSPFSDEIKFLELMMLKIKSIEFNLEEIHKQISTVVDYIGKLDTSENSKDCLLNILRKIETKDYTAVYKHLSSYIENKYVKHESELTTNGLFSASQEIPDNNDSNNDSHLSMKT